MTALAYQNTAFEPVLDRFDSPDGIIPARPQLRLIEGGGYGAVVAAAQPVAPTVELYRRRRFLALVAVSALVLALAWAAGISVLSFGGTTAATATSDAPAVHVVLPGDTYGAIAADLGVANPAQAAEQLRAANGGADLVVGQRLVVNLASLTAG